MGSLEKYFLLKFSISKLLTKVCWKSRMRKK